MYNNLYVAADSNVKINFDLRNNSENNLKRLDVHIDFRRTAMGQKAVPVSGLFQYKKTVPV